MVHSGATHDAAHVGRGRSWGVVQETDRAIGTEHHRESPGPRLGKSRNVELVLVRSKEHSGPGRGFPSLVGVLGT